MKVFHCDCCKNDIKRGEFMAVLAQSPTKEYVGRTDSIIEKWVKTTDGEMYCEECFHSRNHS